MDTIHADAEADHPRARRRQVPRMRLDGVRDAQSLQAVSPFSTPRRARKGSGEGSRAGRRALEAVAARESRQEAWARPTAALPALEGGLRNHVSRARRCLRG